MQPKFPSLLSSAVVTRDRVRFPTVPEIRDDELVEYMAWKGWYGISVLTPARLRSLYRRGLYKAEIEKLFKSSRKLRYLGIELGSKPVSKENR